MEEDAGKLTHVGGATGRIQGADYSLVDYNRAGVPLVEIVTKPIEGAGSRAPELAKAYVAAVRDIVKNLGVSDAKMERGNVRCDANVSLRPHGRERFGIRTETKNVNSLRAVEHAVRYEIQRHAAVLDSGEPVTQETRHWHEDTRTTTSGRRQVRRRRLPLLPRAGPGARSSPPANGSRSSAPPCPSRRPPAASGCRPTGATRTWSSAMSSTPASWTRSRKPSPRAPPPPWPANGGWARSSDAPRTPTSTPASSASHRPPSWS